MAGVSSEHDRTRFQALVLPHLADAYALAGWLAGNRADAEDIVREACLRAFQGFAGFANGNARAWLLTIVRNTAYSWLGKNRAPELLLVDDLVAVEQKQAGRNGNGGVGDTGGGADRESRCDQARSCCCRAATGVS
jgi:DNA-directed RNA polymerase specialized sigma24 family protein